MTPADRLIANSRVDPDWRPLLQSALQAVDGAYLQELLDNPVWLPGPGKLLAAFRIKPADCRYILFGESPYPRAESANGIAFFDAAVGQIWSENGMSKAVNRATSLRNIIKTALLAEDLVKANETGQLSQQSIAAIDKFALVQTLEQMFERMMATGVLPFNATPVLHPERNVKAESRQWTAFIDSVLNGVYQMPGDAPTLILWGKIAQQIDRIDSAQPFPKIACEHPYNVSFIHNPKMHELFARLRLLSGK